MTYRHLYSSLPKIRKDTAIRIANHIVSHASSTRKDIALDANISLMSASKAVASLFDSGIISEKERISKATLRPCGHVSLFPDNTFIIIDITDKS